MSVSAQSRLSNQVIRASAGTGKTYQLTNRFLRLLRDDHSPERILATTFTRKAAGEILDRVLFRLAEAATDSDKLRQLATDLDNPALTVRDCQQLLVQLTRDLHRLRIGTLDSFFAQIVGSFSLDLGMPAGWQIVDDFVDRRLRTRAVDSMLRSDATRDTTTLVNLLTKGDADRSIRQLVQDTISQLYELFQQTAPQAWRAIPRPNRLNADELLQALDGLWNIRLPTNKHWEKSHEESCAAALLDDWETFISKGIAKQMLDGKESYYRVTIEPDVAAAYGRLIQHAKATLLEQLAQQTEATYQLLTKFDEHYRRLKYEQQSLRFVDITNNLAAAIDANLVEHLTHRLDGRLDHLLLDEFQDTSLAQWHVLRHFAKRVTGDNDGRSFFCVGDVKQAIYGWRGGIAEIFDAVDRELAGLSQLSLDTSYRSAPPVIDTVNRVFGNLDLHPRLGEAPAVQSWNSQFREHTTAKTDLTGYCCLETAAAPEQDEQQTAATLRFAAGRIAKIAAAAPSCQVGVLVRRNAAVGQLIYHLNRLQVNASEEGGNPLTDSAAVQLVLALFRLADHPGDTAARFHLTTSPLGPWLPMKSHEDDNGAHELSQALRQSLVGQGYGRTVYHWAEKLLPSCNERELSRLEQLIALAYSYQPNATLRTGDFITFVEQQRVADPSSSNIRVMTVHQAKGLQFDIVVLPDLDFDLVGQRQPVVVGRPSPTEPINRVCRYCNAAIQRLLPKELQQLFVDYENGRLAEALCLLYVALTRAVHAVHMIIAPSKKSERTIGKTYAGLLRATLTEGKPLKPETTAFEHGDPNWHTSADARPADAGSDATTAPTVVRLASPTGRRRRGLDRASPSSREGGGHVDLANILQLGGSAARDRGTLIHAWFEQIEWLNEHTPTDDKLRDVAATLAIGQVDIDEHLQRFRQVLRQPAIAKLLTPDDYAATLSDRFESIADTGRLRLEVHNEQGFAICEENTLVRGYIDRLALIYDQDKLVAADIIDFKTDAVDAGDAVVLRQRVEYYRPQLETYRSAVSQLFGLAAKQIGTRLVFVDATSVVVD